MNKKAEIKAVAFDLGKVLVDFDWDIAVNRIAPFTSLNSNEIIPKVTETDLVRLYEEGIIDCDDFALEIIELIGADVSIEELVSFWSEIFMPLHKNLWVKIGSGSPPIV